MAISKDKKNDAKLAKSLKTEESVELSDSGKKINLEAGLMFGNQNKQIEESILADEIEKSEHESAAKKIKEQLKKFPEMIQQEIQENLLPESPEDLEQPSEENLSEEPNNQTPSDNETPNENQEEIPIHSPSTKKAPSFVALGAIVLVFAIIGAISVIRVSINGIQSAIHQDALKEILTENVYPLVIVDTPEFKSPSYLDQKVIISSGIWKFIMEEENKDKYETDDFGVITVPQIEIEHYIHQLFGNDVKIQHQMIPDTEFYIPYDEENQVYYIPQTPQLLPYAPKILSIQNMKNSIFEVEVGYLLAGPFWNVQKYANDEPSKVMKYTLQKNDHSHYQVLSVTQVLTDNSSTIDDFSSLPSQDSSQPIDESSQEESSQEESSQEETSIPEATDFIIDESINPGETPADPETPQDTPPTEETPQDTPPAEETPTEPPATDPAPAE